MAMFEIKTPAGSKVMSFDTPAQCRTWATHWEKGNPGSFVVPLQITALPDSVFHQSVGRKKFNLPPVGWAK